MSLEDAGFRSLPAACTFREDRRGDDSGEVNNGGGGRRGTRGAREPGKTRWWWRVVGGRDQGRVRALTTLKR